MVFGSEEPAQALVAREHPAWLWAARAAAAVSIATVAWPILRSARASFWDPSLWLGGAALAAYGLVLVLLARRGWASGFSAGLALGSCVGLFVLGVVLVATFVGRIGLPGDLAVGTAQLVLVGACIRISRSHPSRGRLQGYGLASGLLSASLFSVILGPIMHHPVPYDSYAISDLRSFGMAQAVYESANLLYGSPACLARPTDCVPGYATDGPIFFGPEAPAVHSAYLRVFHPGPAETAVDDAGVEHAGFASWALTAVPLRQGMRGFCADASGAILFTADGGVPPVEDGACVPAPGVQYLD